MSTLELGPILRHVGETTASVWVQTSAPAKVTVLGCTARTFEVRHVQLGRALFAAVAAIMITFSADHSAEVGLAVFSGWAIATPA